MADDAKETILVNMLDTIGTKDIAVVYVDPGETQVETEVYYPQIGHYHVIQLNRDWANEASIGQELARRALDYWQANIR